MPTTDYYQILRVLPTANTAEIKKSYRQLAMEFHPDRNTSIRAAEQFTLIKEAYAILSDPKQRKRYDATRFHESVQTTRIATTPEEVRWMSEELVNRLKNMNPERINRDKLVIDLEAVLSVYHIQLLERWKDQKQNELLIQDVLFCLENVDQSDCLRLVQTLYSLDGLTPALRKQIDQFVISYQRNYYWNKYKIVVALIIAVLLCYLIYLS